MQISCITNETINMAECTVKHPPYFVWQQHHNGSFKNLYMQMNKQKNMLS